MSTGTTTMNKRLGWIAVAVAGALTFAACGGGDDDDDASPDTDPATTPAATEAPATTAAPATTEAPPTTPAPTTPTTEAPATTAPPTTEPTPTTAPPTTEPEPTAPELPDTPATAVIETTYDFSGGAPDPELLPAQPGDVTAKWYRAGATYALVYEGLDPTAPACPGNSGQTTAGFDFVSNAPMPEGDCADFATAIENTDTQGVKICADRVSYLTLIPSDFVAVLYSSIERPVDGGGVGLTGFVLVEDPTTLPEIDPALLSC